MIKMTTNYVERLAMVETDIKYIKEKTDDLNHKLDTFIESADKKYASKLTETIVNAMIGVIVLAVLGAIVALVVV